MDSVTPVTRPIRSIIKTNKLQVLSTNSTPGPSPTQNAVKKLRFFDQPSPKNYNSGQSSPLARMSEISSLEELPNIAHSFLGHSTNDLLCNDLKISVISEAKFKNEKESKPQSSGFGDNLIEKNEFEIFNTLETEIKETCGFLKNVKSKLNNLRSHNQVLKQKNNSPVNQKVKNNKFGQDVLDYDIYKEHEELPNCTLQCGIF